MSRDERTLACRARALTDAGATVELREYRAGHGWAAVREMAPGALVWTIGQVGWEAPAGTAR